MAVSCYRFIFLLLFVMPRIGTRIKSHDERYAITLVRTICKLAGAKDIVERARRDLEEYDVPCAIRSNQTAPLFDWLMNVFSYQGISNAAVYSYMKKHGAARFSEVERVLSEPTQCPKLSNYWSFEGCGYRKSKRMCSNKKMIRQCPVPKINLRNGRLSQTAFSLFFFIQDIANDNLVTWIDERIEASGDAANEAALQDRLIEPMKNIFGISDKVLSMTLATLFIGAFEERPRWFEIGADMIAIDTLVHNFFYRTGILRRFKARHLYGDACYAKGGCADILRHLASKLDAKEFNKDYPSHFPRFVQNAIWRFCGQTEMNICNGVQIDDRSWCRNEDCPLFCRCDRIKLLTYTAKHRRRKMK